jgi:uncharacterized protein (TIGR00369 family)
MLRRDPRARLHGGCADSFVAGRAGGAQSQAMTDVHYGAIIHLPDGASGFVTIELHTNFLGTSRHGALLCTATPVQLGRSTQVWDAVVRDEPSWRTPAIFRCTQMVLRDER